MLPEPSAPMAADRPAASIGPDAVAVPARHSFQGAPIRSIAADGDVLFIASDLCRALRLPLGGKVTPAKYIRRLDNRHKAHRVMMTSQGPKLCAVLTTAGALDLATPPRRKREVDRQFRLWMNDVFASGPVSNQP